MTNSLELILSEVRGHVCNVMELPFVTLIFTFLNAGVPGNTMWGNTTAQLTCIPRCSGEIAAGYRTLSVFPFVPHSLLLIQLRNVVFTKFFNVPISVLDVNVTII